MEKFIEEQNRLLAAYDKLPELGDQWLRAVTCTREQIEHWKNELGANRFKLCVAGQMNAGKSTLLNAMLFGRTVLPVDDMVMTSVITLIEHVSHNPDKIEGACVEFYTQAEWRELIQQLKGNEKHWADFNKTITSVVDKGNRPEDYLGQPPRYLHGFDELKDYIATIAQGGIYTPYVKQVKLYADRPELKELVIVDTPGINDPNAIRARITENWMKQADAVVYVTYAGHAMSSTDIEFINRFMIHVTSSHRIIAVNKVDGVDNEAQLKSHLDGLRQSEEQGVRHIFSVETPVVLVSALGALYENDAGEMDEDREFYKNMLGEYVAPERHRVGELRRIIEERLVKNRGEALLKSHRTKILNTCSLVEGAIQGQVSSLEQLLMDSTRSLAQLEGERKKLQVANDHLTSAIDSIFSTGVVELTNETIRTLSGKRKQIIKDQCDEAGKSLNALHGIQDMKLQSQWIYKDTVERACQRFSSDAEIEWVNLKDSAQSIIARLKGEINEMEVINLGNLDAVFSKGEVIALGMLSSQDSLISEAQFRHIISDSTAWYEKAINFVARLGLGKDRAIPVLMAEFRKGLEKELDVALNILKGVLKDAFDRFESVIQNDIAQVIASRRASIDSLSLDAEQKRAGGDSAKSRLVELGAEKSRVQSIRCELEARQAL